MVVAGVCGSVKYIKRYGTYVLYLLFLAMARGLGPSPLAINVIFERRERRAHAL